jgi:phosphoglycerate dehydrogenase-like enzyme
MPKPRVVVSFAASTEMRDALSETLERHAELVYLTELPDDQRAGALESADAVFAWALRRECSEDELGLLGSVGLVQLLSAGVDQVPLDRIPEGVPVASNAGAYAEPMADHVLAMTLALAKRLPQNHVAMSRGEFDQMTPTRELRSLVVGILGFGGIGKACSRLFRALGVRTYAINRSGQTDEPVDRIGALDELDQLLADADVVVVSLPLSRTTRGLIGARELALMKTDAILVNVARAAIIDEDALYEHLRANPLFSAGIDAWWQEPRQERAFRTRRPFFELANVLGSPHNSAIASNSLSVAVRMAAENVARSLHGEPAQNLVDRSDYVA